MGFSCKLSPKPIHWSLRSTWRLRYIMLTYVDQFQSDQSWDVFGWPKPQRIQRTRKKLVRTDLRMQLCLEVVHWNLPHKLRYPAIIVHLAPYSIPWNCVCPRKVRIEGLNNNYFSALESVVEVIWLVVSNPLKNMLVSWDYSSHYMEKSPFIVDFPIEHGGVPSFFVGFQLF